MILIADCARVVWTEGIKGLKTASFPLLASAAAILTDKSSHADDNGSNGGGKK
jgi:hypothetical protein